MAFFPIDHYRGSTDPTDRYFGNQLHLFDPWCDVDTLSAESDKVPVSFRWVNRPRRFTRTSSLGDQNQHYKHSGQSEKFHVQLNVADFNPDSIKTHVEGQNVIVEAKQEDRQPNGDFHVRELRKTYELPEHANARHVVSFITPQHILVIEAPIRNPDRERELAEVESSEQNLAQFGKHLDPQFDYGAFLGGPFKPHIIDNNEQQFDRSIRKQTEGSE
ncbi:unnamed protein product [Rotaria sordida]|uniref:SHSP domain-containing protein n=1 Tax=Rotaria sordida TaxID=392033 RepID=A0A815AGA9_9BILA|nr:unnamed protein product [Rotaria sordida]CAF1256680.1 unnamed protein product [Rotaria sordida]